MKKREKDIRKRRKYKSDRKGDTAEPHRNPFTKLTGVRTCKICVIIVKPNLTDFLSHEHFVDFLHYKMLLENSRTVVSLHKLLGGRSQDVVKWGGGGRKEGF